MNINDFKNTNTYKTIVNIGMWILISWCILALTFAISYSFSFISEDWGAIGWIVPLILILPLSFLLYISIGYSIFVFYKEIIRKGPVILAELFEKSNLYFENKYKALEYIALTCYIMHIGFILITFHALIVSIISAMIFFNMDKNKNYTIQ